MCFSKIKSAVSIMALSFFCAANLCAYQIQITVTDKDLDFPLEGVKVSLAEDALSGNSNKEETGRTGLISGETDENGVVTLEIPDSIKSGNVILSYPGYKIEKIGFSESLNEIAAALVMADVIEGKELVVERSAPGVSDEQSGVSVVLDKETFESTSRMGLVEDVMSSVSTLPGITYGGGVATQPSVRGGYPRDTTAVMDGVYLLYPWQWGGAYSIFDPGMIDSVKMSNGVFSARYGRALAGLLEVNTITPKADKLSFDFSISDIMSNLYLQVPFTEKAGLFVTAKISYLDGLLALYKKVSDNETLNDITTCPYIRNGYAKFYYNPSTKLNFTLSGFIGADGIGYDSDSVEDGLTENVTLDYSMFQAFTALNAKWLATEKLQFKGFLSYAYTCEDVAQSMSVHGKVKYSEDFINQYGSLLSPQALASKAYTLPKMNENFSEVVKEHLIEGKVEGDYEISKNLIATGGADVLLGRTSTTDILDGWQEIRNASSPIPDLKYVYAELDAQGSLTLNSAAYALLSFGSEASLFNGEVGIRADHFFVSNKNEDLFLNSKPAFSPRGTIQYTPWRDLGIFNRISFSAGAGLFSTIPIELGMADKTLDLDNCELNKAVFSVLGTELQFADDWSFKLEGYYRYYYSRLYIIQKYENNTSYFQYHNDGIGYSYGFDLMLQKKTGKYVDGYLSYSFINAKFKNPTAPDYSGQMTLREEPLDEWYYPSYHRFHTLNLVVNYHPTSHWDFMIKGTFATGTPLPENGELFSYPVMLPDGTVIQRYTQSSVYSDTLRTQIACPVDIRIAYKNTSKNGKIKWEIYGGAQDIFTNLYAPKGGEIFDAYTGEKSSVSANAGFNIGMPLINIGFKLSY